MNPSLILLYRFWVQVGLTAIILIFCLFNLSFQPKGARQNQSLYSNLIFFIIGFWLPSPGNQPKKDGQLVEHSDNTNIYPPPESGNK